MISATFYAKHKLLSYWQPDGMLMSVWCDSLDEAMQIVRNLPIKQVIQINDSGGLYEVTEGIKQYHAHMC